MESSKKYSKEQNLKSAHVIDAYLQSFTDPDYFHFLIHDPSFANFIQLSLVPYFQPWDNKIVAKATCLHIRGTDLKYLFDVAALKVEVKQILDKFATWEPHQQVTVVTDDIAFAQTLLEPTAKIHFQSENWQIDFLTLANAHLMGLIDSTFSIWAGLYGLVVLEGITMVASASCIQKYPLLSYLHQQQRIKSLEDMAWK